MISARRQAFGYIGAAAFMLQVATMPVAAQMSDVMNATQVGLTHIVVPMDARLDTSFQRDRVMDILYIDQDAHRLYTGDDTTGGVDVFDISGPKGAYLKTIPTDAHVSGVVVAKNVNKVFAATGTAGVSVIDINRASP